MVTAPLVSSDIEIGREFLQRLDRAGFPVRAALWLYDEEAEQWTLMVATPLVDAIGQDKAYARFREAIEYDPRRVTIATALVSPKTPLIKALRSVFGEARSVEGARLGNTVVGDQIVGQAYLYRVK